jgi:phosphatidylglycerol---prolipoprotein diacylglyceryl transferase
MNGCCWGGTCETPWLAITFPPSPPYLQQLSTGELLGLTLSKPQADGSRTIEAVAAKGRAAESGLRPGDRVTAITPASPDQIRRALAERDEQRPVVQAVTSRGTIAWYGADLPPRTRPVHPTQIYASLNGALLAFLLWFYYPFRRRDGEVLALLITLYPITRFLLETIRVDEAGVLGTTLSISQVVSLGLFAAAMLMWGFLLSRPQGSALPASPSA